MIGRRLVLGSLLVLALPVQATRIDPLTWEELVLQADFVGVVECVVAGGIVALLSNSAKASGVSWLRDDLDVRAWWQENAEKIRLVDPWFALLEQQKVD